MLIAATKSEMKMRNEGGAVTCRYIGTMYPLLFWVHALSFKGAPGAKKELQRAFSPLIITKY